MTIGALKEVPSPTSPTIVPTIDGISARLAEADRAMADAVAMLAGARIAREEGLPEEAALRLIARRTGFEARELSRAADAVRTMPALARCLSLGQLTWAQARAIAREVRPLDLSGRASIDALVARRAPQLTNAEADQIIEEVAGSVFELRSRAERAREAREVERSFLVLQRRLGGGGCLYGEADEVSFATICEAIDAQAEAPRNADEDPGGRGAQRMDALVAMCATSLGGGAGGTGTTSRPARPLVIATAELTQTGLAGAARVLTRVAGRPPKLSPVGAETLLCDADLVAVLFEHGRPITVSDLIADAAEKVRAAIVARDGGCRFPGCEAPASWCQLHHIEGRSGPRAHHPDNLVLLCTRCHDRVHRQRWRISHAPGGLIEFRRGTRCLRSAPRARVVDRR